MVLNNGECFSPVIAPDVFRILGVLNSTINSTWAYCDIDVFCEWTKKLLDASSHKAHIFHHWFESNANIQEDTFVHLESTHDFLIWHVQQSRAFSQFIKYFLDHLFEQGFVQETHQGTILRYTPIDDQFLMYHGKLCMIAQEIKNIPADEGIRIFGKRYKELLRGRILRANIKHMIHTTGPGKLNAVVEKSEQNPHCFLKILTIPIHDDLIVSAQSWVSQWTSERILEDEFVLSLP